MILAAEDGEHPSGAKSPEVDGGIFGTTEVVLCYKAQSLLGISSFALTSNMSFQKLLPGSLGDGDDAVYGEGGELLYFAAGPVDFNCFYGGGLSQAEVGAGVV